MKAPVPCGSNGRTVRAKTNEKWRNVGEQRAAAAGEAAEKRRDKIWWTARSKAVAAKMAQRLRAALRSRQHRASIYHKHIARINAWSSVDEAAKYRDAIVDIVSRDSADIITSLRYRWIASETLRHQVKNENIARGAGIAATAARQLALTRAISNNSLTHLLSRRNSRRKRKASATAKAVMAALGMLSSPVVGVGELVRPTSRLCRFCIRRDLEGQPGVVARRHHLAAAKAAK